MRRGFWFRLAGHANVMGFNRSRVCNMGHFLQKDPGSDLIPRGRWLPGVASRASTAGRKPLWGARLKYCSSQLHPHTFSLKFYRCMCEIVHLLLHHTVMQLRGSCAGPWWLHCCKLAHSSHIQWNMMVSEKFILLPLTRWSVLLANLTVSTIINYCFHYAVCHTFYYRDFWNLFYLKWIELNQESSK